MENRIWILGASDPEMAAIEALLFRCGETVRYATIGGRRVSPGEAYRMDLLPVDESPWGGALYLVECGDASVEPYRLFAHPDSSGLDADIPSAHYLTVRSIDHHREGDAGHGRPPADFFAASSIGQVVIALANAGTLALTSWTARLGDAYDRGCIRGDRDGLWVCVTHDTESPYDAAGRWLLVPPSLVLTAAADHCLGHAYAGHCPGIDPDALLRHRVAQQVAFRACSVCGGTGGATGCGGDSGYEGPCHGGPLMTVESVIADIAAAKVALDAAPWLWIGSGSTLVEPGFDGAEQSEHWYDIRVRDMRGVHVPGLPDAGTRYGIPYIADGLPGPGGRVKIVCSGDADEIRAFLLWAPSVGLVDCYGDPERGFAGGYMGL